MKVYTKILQPQAHSLIVSISIAACDFAEARAAMDVALTAERAVRCGPILIVIEGGKQ